MTISTLAQYAIGSAIIGAVALAGGSDHPPDFDELWDMRDPETTRQVFRRLLADHPDATPAWILELKTQIARTHSRVGEYEQAHAVLDTIEPALADSAPRARLRYLLERGRTLRLAGEPERSQGLFVEAQQLGETLGDDYLTIDAAHMLALVSPDKNEAKAWNLYALNRARDSEATRARNWVGSLTYNMGWDAFESGRLSEALSLFEEGRDFFVSRERGDRARTAQYAVGRTLRALGRNEDALQLQLELERENEAAGTPYGFNFEELAELYWLRGECAKAKVYFAKAWPLLSALDWFTRSEPERLHRIARLAGVDR